jgi:tetrahydromethanopterin S-methyltransferase subunit H
MEPTEAKIEFVAGYTAAVDIIKRTADHEVLHENPRINRILHQSLEAIVTTMIDAIGDVVDANFRETPIQ